MDNESFKAGQRSVLGSESIKKILELLGELHYVRPEEIRKFWRETETVIDLMHRNFLMGIKDEAKKSLKAFRDEWENEKTRSP